MVWGTLVAIYLFMAGVAAGAYLLGTLIEVVWHRQGLDTIRKYGLLLSVPMVGISSVFLILDAEAGLHNPLRLAYVVANFPNSMMSVGTLIITGFQLVTLLAAWKALHNEKQPVLLRIVGSLLALGLTVYTGLLLGVSAAIPFWNNAILPVLFTVSAASTGFAAAILLGVYVERNEMKNLLPIKRIHVALLLTELFLVFCLLFTSAKADTASTQSVMSLLTGQFALLFWIGLVMIGLVLPAAVEFFEIAHQKQDFTNRNGNAPTGMMNQETAATQQSGQPGMGLLILTEGSVLTGGFILRYLVLAAGVYVSLL